MSLNITYDNHNCSRSFAEKESKVIIPRTQKCSSRKGDVLSNNLGNPGLFNRNPQADSEVCSEPRKHELGRESDSYMNL